MEIDGELQVDAALDPITAKAKKIDGPVADMRTFDLS